ncbi:hypothetical protein Tco_1068565 [Tanacetum coccineum]|uniref:PiggyBac transposable element-derived protein domain-containing protein n=1 Tax=Tanacetum coccineum TaxID=301880 RepID=A0ABQ5HG21_9ASTR
MEQMTSICDMVGQFMQRKEEDRRIVDDQAAKDRNWKIPICYNDDEDEYSFATQEYLKKFSSAITPDLLKSDSLIMEDEHLDTIPETELDELIKSSVEDLVHIPSEFEGISEDTCDVPVCEDPSTFDALKDHSEILSDSNERGNCFGTTLKLMAMILRTSEYVSLRSNNDQEEKEDYLRRNLQIQALFFQ